MAHLPDDSFYETEKRKRQNLLDQFKPYGYQKRDSSARNRRLVFFDLLLIVIIMGVIYPFIMDRFGPQRWIGDYRFTYTVTPMSNDILHTLEVEAREGGSNRPPVLEVYFSYSGSEEGEPQMDLAPMPGAFRVFTSISSPDYLPEYATCRVTSADEEWVFRKRIGRVPYLEPFRNIFSSSKLDG